MTVYVLIRALDDQLHRDFIELPQRQTLFQRMGFESRAEPTSQTSTYENQAKVALILCYLVRHFNLESADQLCQMPLDAVYLACKILQAQQDELKLDSGVPGNGADGTKNAPLPSAGELLAAPAEPSPPPLWAAYSP